ncbi:MAG: hypothetical protein R2788_24125 [Saprospiraceae bacterium]
MTKSFLGYLSGQGSLGQGCYIITQGDDGGSTPPVTNPPVATNG